MATGTIGKITTLGDPPVVGIGQVITPEMFANLIANVNAFGFGSAAIADDFYGPTVNGALWSTSGTVTVNPTAGANGAVTINQNGVGTSSVATNGGLNNVGTVDFYFSWRVKGVAIGTGAIVKLGIFGSSTPAEDLYFKADPASSANWLAMNNTTVLGTSSVLTSDYTSWHLYELIRTSGAVTFKVDGATVYSGTFATNIAGGPNLSMSGIGATGQSAYFYVDRVRGYINVT